MMTEHIQRIALNELNRIRITCENCKVVVEIDLKEVENTFSDTKCKHCDRLIVKNEGGVSNLEKFASYAIKVMEDKNASVDFVIPIKKQD